MTLSLDYGLSAHETFARAVDASAYEGCSKRALAFYLAEIQDRKLCNRSAFAVPTDPYEPYERSASADASSSGSPTYRTREGPRTRAGVAVGHQGAPRTGPIGGSSGSGFEGSTPSSPIRRAETCTRLSKQPSVAL